MTNANERKRTRSNAANATNETNGSRLIVRPRPTASNSVRWRSFAFTAFNSVRWRSFAFVAFVALSACGEAPQLPGSVGSEAPAYAAVSVAGDSVRLADLEGQVVLLNIWATWCIPCRREIPELQALHQEYSGRGLHVVGVSVDEAGAGEDVAGFIRDFSMTYTVLRDPSEVVSNTFRIREGIVRWKQIGTFKAGDPAFRAALEKTL
jgi:cytochrome c-type biogenesis protein